MKQVEVMSDELLTAILHDLQRNRQWPERMAEIIQELRTRAHYRNSPHEEQR